MSIEESSSPVRQMADQGFRLALAGDDAKAVQAYGAALKMKLGRQVPVSMHLAELRRSGRREIADRLERLSLRYGADITLAILLPQAGSAAALAEYRYILRSGALQTAG